MLEDLHRVRCFKTPSTPTIERLEIDFGASTYLRLTEQHLDKSTSTNFRLILSVLISRCRLILLLD